MTLPDYPAPRSKDGEYNKVVRQYITAKHEAYALRRERDAWRMAFYAVAFILFALVFTLLGAFFTPHSLS